ncbi:PAS domain S-box protein [candidate division KSB1 bacterium]
MKDIKDSINDNWTKSRIDELNVKYEAESKEKENEILRQKSRISDLELIKQRNIQNTLIWALILIVIYILVLVLYFRYRIKQKANIRLKQLNEVLERIVDERTQDLQNEIDVRVKTEKALRKSEVEFRSLFEESPDAIFVENKDGFILDINPAACKLHNLDREQLIGKHVTDFVPDEEKEQVKESFPKWFTGELSYIESTSKTSDGKNVPVEIRCSRIEYKSNPALLLHVRDITERKKMEFKLRSSESKFRSIFSQANDAIFLMDKNVFIDCNKKTLEMFNCKREDIIGHSPVKFSPEFQPDGSRTEEKANQYISAALKGIPQRFYWKHTRNNDTDFDTEVSLNFIDSGNQKLIQAIVRDITEQKQTEEALISAKKEAEETNRLKSLFLANVSHEIRTPMYGIVGMTDLLMRTPLSNDQNEYLSSISISANSLLTIVNDILDLSKIEAGQLELEHINFDLRHEINEITTILNYKAEKKNISIIDDISKKIPKIMMGDPLRLKQIITNLSDNAIKFTTEGSVKIAVKIIDNSRKNNSLILKFSIIDTGIGISPQEQIKLFKSFSQTDASTTRKFGGTGLGLAISKNLVELMGGEIGVESIEGKGSTFWFTCVFGKSKEITEVKTDVPIEQEKSSSKSLSILVAEDNLINQKVISASLKQMGHKVTIADNGIKTIELFNQQEFDLILMDVQMPEMDGIEATKRIREIETHQNKENIIIIALTANAMKEDKEKCLEAGMNHYLSKPFKNSDLINLLNNN